MAEQNGLNWSQAKVDKLLEQVLNGEIDEYNLPVELYYAIAQKLKDALYKGYGGSLSEFEGEPLELLQELRENLYMFSAAKTYQQTRELTDLLVNEDGTIATKKEFIDGAQAIYDQYNKNWLSTEYETAITSGQSAYAWKDIEATKDVFPYLTFVAVIDANTTDECEHMNGITASVDDPIWNECFVPNHWNCRSVIVKEDDESKLSSKSEIEHAYKETTSEMQDLFKQNVGKTGEVFKKDHDYFTVPKKDAAYARNNFDLPIPDED